MFAPMRMTDCPRIRFTRAELEQTRWSTKQPKDYIPVLVDKSYLAVHAGHGPGRS
jgi:hypothetical protein